MLKQISLILLLTFELLAQSGTIVNPRKAAVINPPTGGGGGVTPLVTLDFEEGDGSDLTYVGANTTFHGDAAYSGSYGMRITASSSDVNYYTFASGLDSVYATFYIYVPSTTTFSGEAYGYSTWVYTTNTTTTRSIFGGHITDVGGGTFKWSTWMMGSSDGTFADNATGFSQDAWHKIKIYYKKGATSVHKIWVDGEEALNATAAHDEVANGFSVCIYQPTATGYIYWDDFKVYDRDPDL